MAKRELKRNEDSALATNAKYGTKHLSKLLLNPGKTYEQHIKDLKVIDKKKDLAFKNMLKSTKDLINWVNIKDEYDKAFSQLRDFLGVLLDELPEEKFQPYAEKMEEDFKENDKDEQLEENFIFKNKNKILKLISEPSLAVYRRWFDYKYFRNEHHRIDPAEKFVLNATGEVKHLNDLFKIMMRYDFVPYGALQDSKGNLITSLEDLTDEQRNDPKFLETYYLAHRNGLSHHLYTFTKMMQLKFMRTNQKLEFLEHNSRFEMNMHMLEIDPELGLAILKTSSKFKDIFCKYREIHDRLIAKQIKSNEIKPWNRLRGLLFKEIHIDDEEAIEDSLKCFSVLPNEYNEIFGKIIKEKWINWKLDPDKQVECSLSGSRGTSKFPIYLKWNHQTEGVMSLVHEVGHSINAVLSKGSGIHSGIVSLIGEIPGFVNEALLFCYYVNNKYRENKKGEYFALLMNYLKRLYENICKNVQYELACFGIEKMFKTSYQFSFGTLVDIYREACDQFGGLTKDEKKWLSNKNSPESEYDFYDFLNVFGAYDTHKTIIYFLGAVVGTSIGLDLYYYPEQTVDKYMAFLKKGNTSDPVKALKELGYDITKPETYTRLAEWLKKVVDIFAKCDVNDPTVKPKESEELSADAEDQNDFVSKLLGIKSDKSLSNGKKLRKFTKQ